MLALRTQEVDRLKKSAPFVAALAVTALVTGCTAQAGTGSPSDTAASSAGANTTQAKLDAYCESRPADPSGTKPDPGDPNLSGTVTIWGWYPTPGDAVIKEFNKLYPKVTVKQETFGLDDVPTKLKTALLSGTGAPDASMLEDRKAPQIAGNGLLDLTKCVGPYATDFPAAKMKKVTDGQGRITAVPWEAGPLLLSYRRSIFTQYGIDAAAIKTWDDFIAAGKKLDVASGGKVKMIFSNIQAVPNSAFVTPDQVFQALTQENGGQLFDDKAATSISKDQATAALEVMKKLRDAGVTLNDSGSANAEVAAVKEKRVATSFSTPGAIFFLQGSVPDTKGDWGAIPVPVFAAGGNSGTNVGGTSFAVTDQNKSPEATWAFLRYWLLTVPGRTTSYKAGLLFENLFVPASKDPFFQQGDPFYNGQVITDLYAKSAAAAPAFNEGATLPALNRAFYGDVAKFYEGSISASDFVANMQSAG